MLDYVSMRIMYNLCCNLVPNKKIHAFVKSSFRYDTLSSLIKTMGVLDPPQYLFVGSLLTPHIVSIIPEDTADWHPVSKTTETGLLCSLTNWDLELYTDAHFQCYSEGPVGNDAKFLNANEFILIGVEGSVMFGSVNLNI